MRREIWTAEWDLNIPHPLYSAELNACCSIGSVQLSWTERVYSTQLNWVELNAWVWVHPYIRPKTGHNRNWRKYQCTAIISRSDYGAHNMHWSNQSYNCKHKSWHLFLNSILKAPENERHGYIIHCRSPDFKMYPSVQQKYCLPNTSSVSMKHEVVF